MTEERWLSDLKYAREHDLQISGSTGRFGDRPRTPAPVVIRQIPSIEPVTILSPIEITIPPEELFAKWLSEQAPLNPYFEMLPPGHAHDDPVLATPVSYAVIAAPAVAMLTLWAGRLMQWGMPILMEKGLDKLFDTGGMSFGAKKLHLRIMTSEGPGKGRTVMIRPEGGAFGTPAGAQPLRPFGFEEGCNWYNPLCWIF